MIRIAWVAPVLLGLSFIPQDRELENLRRDVKCLREEFDKERKESQEQFKKDLEHEKKQAEEIQLHRKRLEDVREGLAMSSSLEYADFRQKFRDLRETLEKLKKALHEDAYEVPDSARNRRNRLYGMEAALEQTFKELETLDKRLRAVEK